MQKMVVVWSGFLFWTEVVERRPGRKERRSGGGPHHRPVARQAVALDVVMEDGLAAGPCGEAAGRQCAAPADFGFLRPLFLWSPSKRRLQANAQGGGPLLNVCTQLRFAWIRAALRILLSSSSWSSLSLFRTCRETRRNSSDRAQQASGLATIAHCSNAV